MTLQNEFQEERQDLVVLFSEESETEAEVEAEEEIAEEA